MGVYTRETVFDAPLADVWELHTTGTGLKRLTPSVFNLQIEAVRGGEPAEPLAEGAEIDISTNPGGIGTRDRWTAAVVDSEYGDDEALFRDAMRDGTFPTWIHTHRFEPVFDGQTLMRDSIEYQLPTMLGDVIDPLAAVGFEPMFTYRHRKAAKILADTK
jgi:ligand-binding SRPBCC domain-containing protein